jgi:hypothetical protein
METAKIDIRKLQLLNDRISQTIDALNQVRMSVHGLAHSNPQATTAPTLNVPATVNPFAAFGTTWAATPMGYVPTLAPNQVIHNQLANLLSGLNHSTPEINDPNLLAQKLNDLNLLARISQTFPFAYSTLPITANL